MEGHDNVVPLGRSGRMIRGDATAKVERHWEALRRGRLAPARSEVDPRAIAGALEWAFILERIAPGLARVRVAGQRLNDLSGTEVRGLPFSMLFEPAVRPAVSESLEAVYETPAIVEMDLVSEGGFGKAELAARMILLPLRSDLGDITRALGAITYSGEVGRVPRRFAIADEVRQSLTGYGQLPADAPRTAARDAKPVAASERVERPYLRLITSDT